MRAFKKLMAATIATAMAATMATSAFAAELNSNGKMVLSESESYTAAGQTTVLVVPYDNWVEASDQTWSITGLTDADILYINQWETAAEAQAAITEGLGVKLTEGTLADINETKGAADYYVLFGGNTGANGAFAITALECVIEPEGTTIVWGDVNADNSVDNKDAVRLFRHTSGVESLAYTEAELTRICNVNGDTVVDNKDSVRLFRHTSGVESIEGMISGAAN